MRETDPRTPPDAADKTPLARRERLPQIGDGRDAMAVPAKTSAADDPLAAEVAAVTARADALEARVAELEARLEAMAALVQGDAAGGLRLFAAGTITLSASKVVLDAALVESAGVVKAATVDAEHVKAETYAPGAGNIL